MFRELEIEHPAAKMLVLGSQMQGRNKLDI